MTETEGAPLAYRAGMVVWSLDGPVGLVDAAIVSPRTGTLARLVVVLAGRRDRYLVVPADWLPDGEPAIGEDDLVLNVGLDQLATAPQYQRTAEGWLRPTATPTPLLSAAPPPDDLAIESAFRAALTTGVDGVDSRAVRLSVRGGVVTLTGRVRTAAEAYLLRRRARDLDGIWHVRGDLISDEALLAAARRVLATLAPGAAVEARVNFGRVEIVGDRDALAGRGAAIEIALRSGRGVESVTLPV